MPTHVALLLLLPGKPKTLFLGPGITVDGHLSVPWGSVGVRLPDRSIALETTHPNPCVIRVCKWLKEGTNGMPSRSVCRGGLVALFVLVLGLRVAWDPKPAVASLRRVSSVLPMKLDLGVGSGVADEESEDAIEGSEASGDSDWLSGSDDEEEDGGALTGGTFIPRVFHLLWKNKNLSFDDEEHQWEQHVTWQIADRLQALHPRWERRVWTDDECEVLVKRESPELWSTPTHIPFLTDH